ncbi:MAG: ferritin [archaeon]
MLQEDRKDLKKETLDQKRAIDSLMEEFGAIDVYNQRADACSDENLKKILIHNRDEEKEHAVMLIEWLRQNDSKFSKDILNIINLKTKDIASKESH